MLLYFYVCLLTRSPLSPSANLNSEAKGNIWSTRRVRRANISANIITKIKTEQYIALDKVESICKAMDCTPNDILVFLPDNNESEE